MKRYRTINVRADAGRAASGHHHAAQCQATRTRLPIPFKSSTNSFSPQINPLVYFA